MSEQENKGIDFIENADTLRKDVFQAEDFFKKNIKLFSIILGVIVAGALAYAGYNYWTKSKDAEAQTAMYQSVFAFEKDSLATALKGDGANEGLLSIADNYGSTPSGKLANFYAGVALLKQGKFDDAIERLKKFDSNDLLVQARAYALIGDAYLEKKDIENAISYYKKAVDYKGNKFFTPGYLMKLANAQEIAKDNKAAIESYKIVIEQYPLAQEAQTAKKYQAKLQAIVGE